jgi:hypothetical protein
MMMFLPMSSTALLMSKEDIPDFTLFSLGSNSSSSMLCVRRRRAASSSPHAAALQLFGC